MDTTINASITYPTTQIEWFADRLGYSVDVPNPDYVSTIKPDGTITDNGLPQTIPNPVDRVSFVKDRFQKMAVTWFTQFEEADLTASVTQQVQTQLAAVRDSVNSAITIS